MCVYGNAKISGELTISVAIISTFKAELNVILPNYVTLQASQPNLQGRVVMTL
jgi:hypothetical protein